MFTHIVFGAAPGAPSLGALATALVERSLRATCDEFGVTVHAVGIVSDHAHLAISVPPTVEVGALVERLKIASTYLLNRAADDLPGAAFAWRESYGACPMGSRPRADVVAYVANQAAHHATGDLMSVLEDLDDPVPPRSRGRR